MLRYEGASHFRERIVISTLSGRPVRIDEIRTDLQEVGLRDYEANFLRLLEKVVNGCEIRINETGTAIRYRPGIITGGARLSHDCGTSRGIGYFVEPLLALAPFAKNPLGITLLGVTNSVEDPSVDVLRTVVMPMLRQFGLDEASLHIRKRGSPPLGGGEVDLQLSTVRELTPVELTEVGRIKRVRGVAYGAKVSPQIANRLVDSARQILNSYLPDVWIYTDLYKGKSSGRSAGFALALVAESTSGALLAAEVTGQAGIVPETAGRAAASALLEEIRCGGVVDSTSQSLSLLLMCLGPEDVSRVRTGPLTPYTVGVLRLIRDYFGVTFQISNDPGDDSVLLVCRGVGFKNLSKRTT